MTMVLLETSFIIDLFQNEPSAVHVFNDIQRKESRIFVAAPTVMELWFGALQSKKLSVQEKDKIDTFLADITLLPLGLLEAKRAAEVEVDLMQKGLMIETEDVQIAGIAMTHGETIVTRDEHYARIPGLRVLKY